LIKKNIFRVWTSFKIWLRVFSNRAYRTKSIRDVWVGSDGGLTFLQQRDVHSHVQGLTFLLSTLERSMTSILVIAIRSNSWRHLFSE
jgi:hypothetical protein